MWGSIPTPHGPCSYCNSPYHYVRDCPTMGQFSNYPYEHMNRQFSRPGNDHYFDSYNPHRATNLTSPSKLKIMESMLHEVMNCTINHICSSMINPIPLNTMQLHNSSTKRSHILGQILTLKIGCCK